MSDEEEDMLMIGSDDLDRSLLLEDETVQEEDVGREESWWEKWVTLVVFWLFSFNQGLLWITFSGVDQETVEDYYSKDFINEEVIALLLNWGPIVGLVFYPVSAYLLSLKDGLRINCIVGILIGFAGALARALPTIFGFQSSNASLIFINLGQALNAAVGPLCMGTVTALSKLWFKEESRTFITSIAMVGNAVGTNVGMLIGPYIPLGTLIILELGISTALLLGIPLFPSKTTGKTEEYLSLIEGVKEIFKSGPYIVVVISAGLLTGYNCAFQASFQRILKGKYSEKIIGWFGFLNGAASNLGVVSMGAKSARHRLRLEILALLVGLLISLILFTKCSTAGTGGEPGMIVVMLLVGGFYGACTPLFYELSAKLNPNVNEGTSTGGLVFLLNFFSFFTILISPYVNGMTLAHIFLSIVGFIILAIAALRAT